MLGVFSLAEQLGIASKREKAHTVKAKLMNCIAKELAIYNEIKMKCESSLCFPWRERKSTFLWLLL